jgi:HD-like signal output (HDOD) protein
MRFSAALLNKGDDKSRRILRGMLHQFGIVATLRQFLQIAPRWENDF